MSEEFDREAMIRRCHALMAKTTENGCTEEEAMAASDMLAKMMDKYDLTFTDLKIVEQKFERGIADSQQKKKTGIEFAAGGIAYFTDTKIWCDYQGAFNGRRYNYFGFEHDVLIATYIHKLCNWAIVRAREDYKESIRTDYRLMSGKQKGQTIDSFEFAMGSRISKRLRDMKDKRRADMMASTGRDLVVVKKPAVDLAWLDLGIGRLKPGKQISPLHNYHAAQAGIAAGDRVEINPGVTAATKKELRHG